MSEGDAYEDFMMSEDEEMHYAEMEEDSDEMGVYEEETSQGAEEEVPLDPSSSIVEGRYYRAKGLKENSKFREAIEALEGVATSSEPLWAFRALKQIAKCWNFKGAQASEGYQDGVRTALVRLLEHGLRWRQKLGAAYVERSLISTLRMLVPANSQNFVFDEAHEICLPTIEFHLRLLDAVAPLPGDFKDLCTLHMQLRLENLIWRERLRGADCTAILSEAPAPQLTAETLLLLLQCHICRFLRLCQPPAQQFAELVSELQDRAERSLALAQQPHAMVLLAFAQCMRGMQQQPQPHSALRTHFSACLQGLEEIGSNSSFFRDLNLCGFVLADALAYSAGRCSHRVDPFALEQIRILRETPIVHNLQLLYESYVALDLPSFARALDLLAPFRSALAPLFARLCALARERKLWDAIAPLHSCIALADIQRLLCIGSSSLSRDSLLTLMMQGVMASSARVPFRLDLTRDYVYFGDEPRVQLRAPAARPGLRHCAHDLGLTSACARPFQGSSALQLMDCLSEHRNRAASAAADPADAVCRARQPLAAYRTLAALILDE
ncbi:ADL153Wp [Eremothecium gossypii ATCC 10895]|uniref:COP9 signalosome complex subunit 10 n=1 Tax=Eremothecium gossypii (strain ATCC 10895 / CBS 109.51 / FGSC 9923 / NRRL Y-1056) TaxID=284811 RepID=CSN10_EREGS|nr:ADL153Wp [Eremothecium gossypii ATCC 10895]Q75AS3.1 RecName: Full=COP9 signalosome complex subunit 10 [Eremothecium gossypii ATCC 10895]AAS51767.1 ADL153Wp [Eremothecium gossypii ATCC 10895]AEY96064.1 FADL153Wp [Eremothecium gossypii FDAG1]